jgi:two-component system sensor histidine kinase HydH
MLLGRLEKEIGRLDEITRHVLLYARPPHAATTSINPVQLIKEVIENIKQQSKDELLTIKYNQLHAKDAMILGDNDQLQQVILNLLLNAIQFADKLSTIELTSRIDDKQWHLTISNHGPEISPEDQAHIFEPFFTTRAEGSGLGLAIGARIVEAHNGTLQCESADGVTRFTLSIPRA